MPKITKRIVDAVVPDVSRRLIVWDEQIIGFGVLVLSSGIKSYFYRYRNSEGRERRATIGRHGPWTTDQARRKAEEMRATVRVGRDPLAEKRERLEAPTVGEMLDAYLVSERFRAKAPSTQAIDRGRLEHHLKPLIGKRQVNSVTPGDVERAFAAIRDGKTAKNVKTRKRGKARVRGGEGTARMSIQLLRSVFGWAALEGLAKSNPCAHVKTGPSGTRDIILEDADDYARLFKTLDRLQQERRIREPVADAIRLIALTGARRGEIAGLRWNYVDLKRGVLLLPPLAHKAGRKTGKPRAIGLPAAAQVIIARQVPGKPDAYVFLPSHGNGPVQLSKPWRKIRVEAHLPTGIGLHGLRHSLASHMAMGGAAAAEIMAVLGHSQLSTSQRYIHWAQDSRQGLAERAASVVIAGMVAASGEVRGDVVKMIAAQ